MRFSLRYDPYSATADEDYEKLKEELDKFDVIGMLNRELAKSRLDAAVTRKLAAAIRHLDPPQKRDAVLSLLGNLDLLYPVLPSIMIALRNTVGDLEAELQQRVVNVLLQHIGEESHLFKLDVNLAYTLQVVAFSKTAVGVDILTRLYRTRTSGLVRRVIMLIMANWGEWHWVSDVKNSFRVMQRPERRAFIVASYILRDEGVEWRKNTKGQFDEFERIVKDWASEKKNALGWRVPV